MIRKPGEYNIFLDILADFTKIRWCMYQGLGHIQNFFTVEKRSNLQTKPIRNPYQTTTPKVCCHTTCEKSMFKFAESCAPDGRLVELLWCPSASQSLASGTSSLSIRGWRSTAAIIKLSPSVAWSTFGTHCSFVDEIKLNIIIAWRILPFNMFVLPYQVVYSLSKNFSWWTTAIQPVLFRATMPTHSRLISNPPTFGETLIPAVRWKCCAFYKVVGWHFSGVVGKVVTVFLLR